MLTLSAIDDLYKATEIRRGISVLTPRKPTTMKYDRPNPVNHCMLVTCDKCKKTTWKVRSSDINQQIFIQSHFCRDVESMSNK